MKNRFRTALLAVGLMAGLATTAVAAPATNPQVQFDTNMGSFVVELEPKAAPRPWPTSYNTSRAAFIKARFSIA